jgi:hypothetical protein
MGGSGDSKKGKGNSARDTRILAYGAGIALGLGMGATLASRLFDRDAFIDAEVDRYTQRLIDRSERGRKLMRLKLESDWIYEETEEVKGIFDGLVSKQRAAISKSINPEHEYLRHIINSSANVELYRFNRRYLFPFHLVGYIREFFSYRNTSHRKAPRELEEILAQFAGDCKDQTTLLANLALADGKRIYYASSTPEEGAGHAFLFVHMFDNPTECDIKEMNETFRFFASALGEDPGDGKPAVRRFADGLYIACDPTNHSVPGIIGKEYLDALNDHNLFQFRPEDYNVIRSCKAPGSGK